MLTEMPDVRIAKLFSYPIKSCRGVELETASLTEYGLSLDRELALSSEGQFLSQRTDPKLACVELAINTDHLIASVQDFGDVIIPLEHNPGAAEEHFKLRWDRPASGNVESKEANSFFTEYLSKNTRLIRIPEAYLTGKGGLESDAHPRGFKDFGRLTLASLTSLEELNKNLCEPISMDNFRANIIIEGGAPYIEDTWQEIQIGNPYLLVTGQTRRCSMVNVNQKTGVPDWSRRISRVLEAMRHGWDRTENKPGKFFGLTLEHRYEPGSGLRIGDPLTVLSTDSK